MAKTKAPVSTADQFRAATSSQRKAEALGDLLDEMEAVKNTLEEAGDKFSNLDDARETMQEFVDFLPSLIEFGIVTQEQCDGAEEALAALGMLITEINPEAITEFVEQFDAAKEALDSFRDLKEEDRYDGKRDDMEAAWDEVVGATETLADLIDAMGDI